MKEIKAILQPFMLDKVLSALHHIEGLPGCTVSKVQGYGKVGRDQEDDVLPGSVERVKLELVVPDKMVSQTVEAITKHAHTGNKGDGKVFVIETVDAVAIRTGKRGEAAL